MSAASAEANDLVIVGGGYPVALDQNSALSVMP